MGAGHKPAPFLFLSLKERIALGEVKMAVDLNMIAKENDIKYFLISFVDLFGVLRAKLVPASAISGMQKEGAGFAGLYQLRQVTGSLICRLIQCVRK